MGCRGGAFGVAAEAERRDPEGAARVGRRDADLPENEVGDCGRRRLQLWGNRLNIKAYLDAQHNGPLAPTAETLRGLQVAHLLAVPFENLSIHAGGDHP